MLRISSFSRNSYAALIAASLVLSSAMPVRAADSNAGSTSKVVNTLKKITPEQKRQIVIVASSHSNDLTGRIAQKPWPAPVGHRQPRESDVAATAQLLPENADERRLDQELKAKLIICRGC